LTLEAERDASQALGERTDRGRHLPVERDQEEASLIASERADSRFQQVGRDVVVESLLRGAHRVLEELRPARHEGLLHELLGLAAERALADLRQARAQLV